MDASHVLNRFNVQAPGFFASQEDADDDDDESLWELSTTVSQDDWSEQVEADEPALQEDASQISSLKAAAAQAFDQGIRSGAFVWAMGLIRENPPSTADEDECMSESGRNLKVEVAATLLKGSADGTLRTALEELRPRPEPLDDPTQNLGPAERELQGAPEPEPAPLSSLLSEARRSLCRALESGLLARAVAAQREPPPALEARRRARGAEISAAPEPEPAGPATAKLSLRLPSGDRLQRTFRADQCLDEVYEWAHCCRPVAKPVSFVLCTTFPARSLTNRSDTLGDAGLAPSSALLMKEADA